jgi:osmoprotectant transport system permease protein
VIPLLAQVPFPNWGWLANPRTHERMVAYTVEHLQLTLLSVLLGLAIALPLAVAAQRRPRLHTPLLTLTGILYTVPSVAMFIFLIVTLDLGFSLTPAVIGLALYSLIVLFRNTVTGLASVPADVREAGQAMGYSPRQLLWRVELPVALPVVIAGLRIATVTCVGLVTITALFGLGGIGTFFITGFNRLDFTILGTAVAMVVVLALLLDLLLVLVQRLALPWEQGS